ncbi:MAG: hypothetical protein ACLUIX_01945 [Oscillospiraceae bacterium]|jgi:hypothetical protein|uniref:hypothetical protein n=1 Tax=Vescimonas sp. TaxID=2892404 RepID=UPI00307CC926
MSNQIHIIQNAITTTISEIFRGDFRRICEVKKAVLHLEAIYFCHGTCYLLKRENMPIKDQLALYQRIELIPQSTTEFFENNRECIINNWPEESALAAKPEILYDALLASEFCVQPERVGYKIDKVSRDIAGAYYTSSDFSAQITYRALESYMDRKRRRAIDSDSFACCNEYENITFLDYSCGCGEFLLAVIQYFDNHVLGYSRKKLATQLRGVDVNPIALMITIARIVSAVEAEDDENLLREVAKNFIVGNPLLHSDKIAPLEVRFDNFALNRLYAETEGINCLELEQQNLVVLGNPPWEKLRFEERAFFRPVCPAISAISQKNKREKEIKKLAVNWLELLEYYQLLQDDYASVKKEIPKHPLLKVSLVGELNTYAMFAELASRLTEKDGFAAIIVKSALVTSTCYSSCFRHFVNQGSLSEVFLFDNREKLFQIDSREKFCVLFFGGEHAGGIKVHYGLTKQEQILSSVPINVTSEELELINPETGLLPNVADSKEFSFLLRTHRSLSVFAKEFPKCHFGRLVHLTAHAEHISTKSEKTRVPIYEGKFIEQYDNRFSTFAGMSADERYQAKASARRQPGDSFVAPKLAPECRYFIDKKFWESFLDRYDQPYSLCWRSLTSPTNQRTMIASIIPSMPTCQSVQLLQTTPVEDLLMILALFNSKVFDFFVRLKMGGIDLTQSVVRQIPVPFREAWNSMVTLHGVDYTALDAVRALERLLYRNEPDLCGLWDGVPEIKNADNYYKTAADVREEIDKIIFQMYGLTSAEEKMVRNSFKA